MSEKVYTIEIADASGHSVVEMTKNELIGKVSQANDNWVFVDNRMVASDQLASIDLDAAEKIRMVPGLVGGADETYSVEIADATGHSVVEMTSQEITQAVNEKTGTWVFVDNRMVAAEHLAKTDFGSAQHIRLVPGLVGGQ
mgnify:CR=1 FL=1|jgi:uncharacterized protein YvpB